MHQLLIQNRPLQIYLYCSLIIFSVAGTLYQIHYWAKRPTAASADIRTAGKFVFNKGEFSKIDYKKYVDEVAHNWKLLIFPWIIFLVFPLLKREYSIFKL